MVGYGAVCQQRWRNYVRQRTEGQPYVSTKVLGQEWQQLTIAQRDEYIAQSQPKPIYRVQPAEHIRPDATPYSVGDHNFPVSPTEATVVAEGVI